MTYGSKDMTIGAPLRTLYLQEELFAARVDGEVTLFGLHVVAETRIANFDVPERQRVLGSLEVIQVAIPGIIHEPPRLVAPQRPLTGQFGQVSAQFRGLPPPRLHLGHIYRPRGNDPRLCATA